MSNQAEQSQHGTVCRWATTCKVVQLQLHGRHGTRRPVPTRAHDVGVCTWAGAQHVPCSNNAPVHWQPLGLNKMSHHAQSKHATQQGHGQPTSLGAAATPLQPVLSRRICTHVQRTTCPSPCMRVQPHPWHKLPQHCSTRCTGAEPQAPQPPPSAAIWAYIL